MQRCCHHPSRCSICAAECSSPSPCHRWFGSAGVLDVSLISGRRVRGSCSGRALHRELSLRSCRMACDFKSVALRPFGHRSRGCEPWRDGGEPVAVVRALSLLYRGSTTSQMCSGRHPGHTVRLIAWNIVSRGRFALSRTLEVRVVGTDHGSRLPTFRGRSPNAVRPPWVLNHLSMQARNPRSS